MNVLYERDNRDTFLLDFKKGVLNWQLLDKQSNNQEAWVKHDKMNGDCSNITDYFSTHKITTPWHRNTHTHTHTHTHTLCIQNKDALTKARTSYVVLKPTNILTPTTTIYYCDHLI